MIWLEENSFNPSPSAHFSKKNTISDNLTRLQIQDYIELIL